jgi:hypothetical protein
VTVCFEVPPLASDAFLITLHPLLENVLQTVCCKLQEDSGTGMTLLVEGFLRNFSVEGYFVLPNSTGLMDEL